MTDPARAIVPHRRDLPDLDEGADDRPSITNADGTVARFDMAYPARAHDIERFGPPFAICLPSYLFATAAVACAIAISVGYVSAPGSRLYAFVIEGDPHRPMPGWLFACILVASAAGTVARTLMRGVIVRPAGIEARYLLPMGIPRVRRWAWAQIHRIVVSETHVALELWDSSFEQLPEVADTRGLAERLSATANARRITVTKVT